MTARNFTAVERSGSILEEAKIQILAMVEGEAIPGHAEPGLGAEENFRGEVRSVGVFVGGGACRIRAAESSELEDGQVEDGADLNRVDVEGCDFIAGSSETVVGEGGEDLVAVGTRERVVVGVGVCGDGR